MRQRTLVLGAGVAAVAVSCSHGAAGHPTGKTGGSPAPQGFRNLLYGNTDPRGQLIRGDGWASDSLTKPGAPWKTYKHPPHLTFNFTQVYTDYGAYQLTTDTADNGDGSFSAGGFSGLKPNRNIIVVAVVRTAFPRGRGEVNIGVYQYRDDLNGTQYDGCRLGGLPANTTTLHTSPSGALTASQGNTDGWARWEWPATTINDAHVAAGSIQIRVYATPNTPLLAVEIADLAVIVLPETTATPFQPGEGLAFRGGPGTIPMKVETCTPLDITTVSARWTIFPDNNTIMLRQRLEFPGERLLAAWVFSSTLAGLRVVRAPENSPGGECVLTNARLSLGVQIDGLLGIVPLGNSSLRCNVTSLFPSPFNRYYGGHLLAEDDWGGFTVSPYLPRGSGRLPQSRALPLSTAPDGISYRTTTEFTERGTERNMANTMGLFGGEQETAVGTLDFIDLASNDTNFTSTGYSAAGGWSIEWTLSPGDRLFTAAMPSRPYDWAKSFEWDFGGCYDSPSTAAPCIAEMDAAPEVDTWILWNAAAHPWAGSWKGPAVPLDTATVHAWVDAAHERNKTAVPYISAWFSFDRNGTAYVEKVQAWQQEFGLDGVYSDGLPEDDWLVAYEEMRMLREIFPDGPLVIHDTIRQEGTPAAEFRPFVQAYATATLLGELMPYDQGDSWQWPRYRTSQYRKANVLGAMKGNAWTGPGVSPPAAGDAQDLIQLVYNGRDRPGLENYSQYLTARAALRDVWANSSDSHSDYFYDQVYLPTAQRLTGVYVGRAAMPSATVTESAIPTLAMMVRLLVEPNGAPTAIHYTVDGSAPTSRSPVYAAPFSVTAGTTVRAVTVSTKLADHSRELTLTIPHSVDKK